MIKENTIYYYIFKEAKLLFLVYKMYGKCIIFTLCTEIYFTGNCRFFLSIQLLPTICTELSIEYINNITSDQALTVGWLVFYIHKIDNGQFPQKNRRWTSPFKKLNKARVNKYVKKKCDHKTHIIILSHTICLVQINAYVYVTKYFKQIH